jgi:hypothetical protein
VAKAEKAARHAVTMSDTATAHEVLMCANRMPVDDFISIDGVAVAGLPPSVTFHSTPIAVGSFRVRDKAVEGNPGTHTLTVLIATKTGTISNTTSDSNSKSNQNC